MSSSTYSPGKTKLGTCPYCGQAMDRDANAHLKAALAREEQRRAADVEKLSTRRVAEAEARLRGKLMEEFAAERKELAARAAELREQAAADEQRVKAAQAHADQLRRELRREDREHAREAEALASKRVAEAEERLRQDLVRRQAAEAAAHETSEKELRRIVEQLKTQNQQLQRDLEKAKPRELGDADEQKLADRLSREFKDDTVDLNPVRRGADVLHTVCYETAGHKRHAGLIVYECKNTQTWSNQYVAQAQAEREAHHAQYVILVPHTFPKAEQRPLFVRDEVVVVAPDHVLAVASLVRRFVIEADRAGSAREEAGGKDLLLHNYITSAEFRNSVESLFKARKELNQLLERERRGHEKTWAKREALYQQIADRAESVDARIQVILHGVTTLPEKGRGKPVSTVSSVGRKQEQDG